MNIEFTQEDFKKLDELIGATPFKYAYPFFQFFTNKVAEAKKVEDDKKIQTEEDGN